MNNLPLHFSDTAAAPRAPSSSAIPGAARLIRIGVAVFCAAILCNTGCRKTAPARADSTAEKTAAADLVIYSPHSADKTEYIAREFRQRTGLTVTVVNRGTGELLDRLTGEEKNGIHTADVFWGGGIESLEASKQLFDPYQSPELSALNRSYVDDGHYWTGFSVMTMVIVYNTNLVPQNKIPRSWRGLDNDFFQGRIIIPDPLKSGSAYSIINAVLETSAPTENWNLLDQIKKRAGPAGLASSSTTIQEAVATGEYFAGLTSEDSALSVIHAGQPLAIVYPSDGTIAVPDGVALVKGAPHGANARRFIDFVLGADVQSVIASRWFRRSVRSDVALPAGAEPFQKMRILPYNVYNAAEKRERILAAWEKL